MADSAPFCPYVGLRPFREEDRPYFFGRENEIRTIADNLYGARLTILYGASGVGKSSVLMAGLVPQLRKEPRTAVVMFRRWQVPQAAALLKRQVIEAASAVGGKSLAIDENLPLDELLKQAADTLDGTILLLLDQFEEYFLYFPDPGPEGGFDAELARAINRRDVDAGFLISMREDSLSKLDRLRKRITTLFGNTQQLSHLWLGAAKLAVLKPLEVYNAQHPDAVGKPVTIEPALVQALLEQVSAGQVSIAQTGGAGQAAPQAEETRVEAPYLQLVLERLWSEEMRTGSRELRLPTLEALGGAGNIVRTHLDQVMERLAPRDQELCARVFDRLVTPSGAKVACRLSDLTNWAKDLAGEVPRVTKILEDNRLLARIPAPPGRPEEDDQYQIFHDVLAPGILDWRSRFLQRKEKEEAEVAAAQKEREAAEERLKVEEAAAHERELRLAEERAESERQRAEQERRLRKRLQYALLAFLFAAGWAAWFGYKAQAAKEQAEAAKERAEADRDAAREAVKAAEYALKANKAATTPGETAVLREQAQTQLAYAQRTVTGASVAPPGAQLAARVYLQIQDEQQRAPARKIAADLVAASFVVPGIERLQTGPTKSTEVRFFRQNEQEQAEAIARVLEKSGVADVVSRYVSGFEDSKRIRERHFEVWFTPAAFQTHQRPSTETSRPLSN